MSMWNKWCENKWKSGNYDLAPMTFSKPALLVQRRALDVLDLDGDESQELAGGLAALQGDFGHGPQQPHGGADHGTLKVKAGHPDNAREQVVALSETNSNYGVILATPNRPHYDDEYDDYQPNSPNSNQFMYRRDSPSRQRSVFSFLMLLLCDCLELLEALVPQVQQTLGTKFSAHQITEELRSTNYDLDKTVVSLLEKAKTTASSSGAVGGVLPLRIQVPRLEAVALSIGDDGKKPAKPTIVMPSPTRGKAAVIGKALQSPSKQPVDAETKPLRQSAADAATSAPAISRAQTQFTPAEKKAFERAELKTQEVALKLEEEARNGGKSKISMVVIGHVDAGKSTITGHLLYDLGYVSKRLMHKYEKESREAGKSSFAYAWVMDADEEERSRGVTMDVGTSYFETATKHVTLLDAPGHRDFIPKMIAGAAQADVAVLVVPAVTGEFEAAFENSGQTKEHTLLVRSLGVAQMVCLVYLGSFQVAWDKERFDNIVASLSTFLQGAGFRLKNLRFVPLSGMSGANLDKSVPASECSWYSGPILCSIASPVRLARRFEAKIMTMPAVEVPLVKGTCVSIHMHNVDEPVNITRLVSILGKSGEVEKKKPRCITRERSAVVHITCVRSLCLEEFANYRQLGRFTLRDRGKTLAAGIITQILA
ncbi:hypothetical protein BBJ28_00014207 [Nothophytophthora sp. Chile5]|nr:hypothetical protein BBJ28_00014207 [Nothophytophthora sp. Chile5]